MTPLNFKAIDSKSYYRGTIAPKEFCQGGVGGLSVATSVLAVQVPVREDGTCHGCSLQSHFSCGAVHLCGLVKETTVKGTRLNLKE